MNLLGFLISLFFVSYIWKFFFSHFSSTGRRQEELLPCCDSRPSAYPSVIFSRLRDQVHIFNPTPLKLAEIVCVAIRINHIKNEDNPSKIKGKWLF